MIYPFEQRFIFAVENTECGENAWLRLILSDGTEPASVVQSLAENGYDNACVRKNITLLKALDLERLINLAMLQDYRSEPAIAVLKTRKTDDIFEKAHHLSQSSSNLKRALAVKILNSEFQSRFLDRTTELLKAMSSTETDDLVVEQLGYAVSKLQIS